MPSKALSGAAGFSEGFATTFVERLRSKREEDERIREEARGEERESARFQRAEGQARRLAFLQDQLHEGQANKALERQTGPQAREFEQFKSGLEVDEEKAKVQERLKLEAQDPLQAAKMAMQRLELGIRKGQMNLGLLDFAQKDVQARLEAGLITPDVYQKELQLAIDNAFRLSGTEMPEGFAWPVDDSITEQTFIDAIGKYDSAQDARVNLRTLAESGVPITRHVKDAFLQRFGESYEPSLLQRVGGMRAPGGAGERMEQSMGAATGAATEAVGRQVIKAPGVQRLAGAVAGAGKTPKAQGSEPGPGGVGGSSPAPAPPTPASPQPVQAAAPAAGEFVVNGKKLTLEQAFIEGVITREQFMELLYQQGQGRAAP